MDKSKQALISWNNCQTGQLNNSSCQLGTPILGTALPLLKERRKDRFEQGKRRSWPERFMLFERNAAVAADDDNDEHFLVGEWQLHVIFFLKNDGGEQENQKYNTLKKNSVLSVHSQLLSTCWVIWGKSPDRLKLNWTYVSLSLFLLFSFPAFGSINCVYFSWLQQQHYHLWKVFEWVCVCATAAESQK